MPGPRGSTSLAIRLVADPRGSLRETAGAEVAIEVAIEVAPRSHRGRTEVAPRSQSPSPADFAPASDTGGRAPAVTSDADTSRRQPRRRQREVERGRPA